MESKSYKLAQYLETFKTNDNPFQSLIETDNGKVESYVEYVDRIEKRPMDLFDTLYEHDYDVEY